MEALIAAIYLAQSGLPVFGAKLSLNVKKIIGMVFLERGSGSTLQLLLEKYKSLLVSLDKCDRNGIVPVPRRGRHGHARSRRVGLWEKVIAKTSAE